MIYPDHWLRRLTFRDAFLDIAAVQLGTPPRGYRLLVDSGSADLWVGAQGCVGDDGGNCVRFPLKLSQISW